MATESTVQTDLRYAGLGDRFLGWIIDSVFLTIVVFPGVAFSGIVRRGYTLLWVGFGIFYIFILEGIWSNQTVGKYLLDMRVVNENGSPAGLVESILRNFVGIVGQSIVFVGLLVGAISISLSDMNQRLGDRVANTVVVKTS